MIISNRLIFFRPGPRPDNPSCQNPWLARIGLVEITKQREQTAKYNEGFQPEEVFKMEEKDASKYAKKE